MQLHEDPASAGTGDHGIVEPHDPDEPDERDQEAIPANEAEPSPDDDADPPSSPGPIRGWVRV